MSPDAHCYVCGKYKPKEDFYNCSARNCGVGSRCKLCDNIRREERRAGLPAELRTKRVDYWDNLSDEEFLAAEDARRVAAHDGNAVPREYLRGDADGVHKARSKTKNRSTKVAWGRVRLPSDAD